VTNNSSRKAKIQGATSKGEKGCKMPAHVKVFLSGCRCAGTLLKYEDFHEALLKDPLLENLKANIKLK
jgi:hypothetical protein